MSSAHSFITEAQLDLAFTFILSPICLGSTLESIPVGCRPTLHWAFSAEPWTKPCRSKKTLCSAYSREISSNMSAFLSTPNKITWSFQAFPHVQHKKTRLRDLPFFFCNSSLDFKHSPPAAHSNMNKRSRNMWSILYFCIDIYYLWPADNENISS